jgi:hypothetical protein
MSTLILRTALEADRAAVIDLVLRIQNGEYAVACRWRISRIWRRSRTAMRAVAGLSGWRTSMARWSAASV